ncbi:unnamed protein product [Closterium sp. NIES-64]|nr:unnamed protein product [Closterium sp. NIES-64]
MAGGSREYGGGKQGIWREEAGHMAGGSRAGIWRGEAGHMAGGSRAYGDGKATLVIGVEGEPRTTQTTGRGGFSFSGSPPQSLPLDPSPSVPSPLPLSLCPSPSVPLPLSLSLCPSPSVPPPLLLPFSGRGAGMWGEGGRVCGGEEGGYVGGKRGGMWEEGGQYVVGKEWEGV